MGTRLGSWRGVWACLALALSTAWVAPVLGEPAEEGRVLKESLAQRVFSLVPPDEQTLKAGFAPKFLLDDDLGRLWLFKPMPVHQSCVEEAGSRLFSLAGFSVPEAFSVALNGKVSGSLQRIVPCKGTVKGLAPESLNARQLLELQKLMVFNWLYSNFDTHGGNFLVSPDDGIVQIDLSQAFYPLTYFAHELASNPCRPESYFAALLSACRSRTVAWDREGVLAFIDEVERIPDPAIDEILRPVARFRIAAQGAVIVTRFGEPVHTTEDEFLFAFHQRRHELRRGFEQLAGPAEDPAGRRSAATAASRGVRQSWTDPASAEPIALTFADDLAAVSGTAVIRRKAEGVVLAVSRFDARQWQEGLKTMFGYVPGQLLHSFDRLAPVGFGQSEVARLDLATVRVDGAFVVRLESTEPAVLKALKQKAGYAAHNAKDAAAKQNAESLRAEIYRLEHRGDRSPVGPFPPPAP